MSKPNWTAKDIEEITEKARGLYLTLVGLTETPREAAEIICLMHMLLFLNHGDGKYTADQMLADYTKSFRENYDLQIAAEKGQLN